jgi:hypothetical protein
MANILSETTLRHPYYEFVHRKAHLPALFRFFFKCSSIAQADELVYRRSLRQKLERNEAVQASNFGLIEQTPYFRNASSPQCGKWERVLPIMRTNIQSVNFLGADLA